MRRPLVALALMIAVVGILADRATAQRRPPQADRRHAPGDRPARHATGRHGPTHEGLRHGHAHPRPHVYSPGRFSPHWGSVYRYDPWWTYDFDYSYGRYPYSYPYPAGGYPYYWPRYYYRYPPPVFLPAETLYGPEAMKRFMGVDHWCRPQADVNVIVAPERADKQPAAAAGQGERRASNQQAITLAWKFIGYGDAHFGNQKYAEANARYRKAAAAAPQLADGWFRQGFALVAIGRYDLAVQAIKRGLKFKANWAESDFRLNELYGGNVLTKSAHLDTLAEAAKKNPNDTDLLFLLGVLFHFDGKPDRAAPLLQRAKQLLAGDDAHLNGFLP